MTDSNRRIEALLRRAAEDDDLRRALVDEDLPAVEAARQHAIELSPLDERMLASVPRVQLAAMISAVAASAQSRRAFLRSVKTVLGVAAGVSIVAGTCAYLTVPRFGHKPEVPLGRFAGRLVTDGLVGPWSPEALLQAIREADDDLAAGAWSIGPRPSSMQDCLELRMTVAPDGTVEDVAVAAEPAKWVSAARSVVRRLARVRLTPADQDTAFTVVLCDPDGRSDLR